VFLVGLELPSCTPHLPIIRLIAVDGTNPHRHTAPPSVAPKGPPAVGGRLRATYSTPTSPRDFYAAVHTSTDVNQQPARKRGAGAFVFGDGRWHVEIIDTSQQHIKQSTHRVLFYCPSFFINTKPQTPEKVPCISKPIPKPSRTPCCQQGRAAS